MRPQLLNYADFSRQHCCRRQVQNYPLDSNSGLRCAFTDVCCKSYFSENFTASTDHAHFIRRLRQLLSKPVLPGDEAIKHLPTQATSEFLANTSEIDGLAFPSTQLSGIGRNVVLFHKTALAQPLEYDLQVRIWHDLDVSVLNRALRDESMQTETRLPTLQMDIDSLQLNWICGVDYRFESEDVYLDDENLYEGRF